ncbi:MAG: hypothetical protein A2840_01555 [Candidatus Buchananbacteria bacterium RIFCSPHIGHO2_01_FULL_47_11b]|uniref:Divalent-cation tolerance protein CutA n=1 Tax=Candidatus Buchananbacteria bacterium RIFCSPHIGHO2_01_FULL_47_11b TaxID=1797537 RepID=A0A1G1Y3Y6_9BACT|nr:MAG: hypothetical protein A2840_01555 [Candidatus Buchananbacteria bacterium RIFCSPHIGHO2_01_FULL_47_11b]
MIEITVTCKNQAEADTIAAVLLQQRLIACANSFSVRSVYRWKGKIERSREVLMIMKTTLAQVKSVKKIIFELHSYELPVITIANKSSAPEVEAWVQKVIHN